MIHYISNYFALYFGETFMKIRPKIAVIDVYIHIMMQIFMSITMITAQFILILSDILFCVVLNHFIIWRRIWE